MSHPKPQDPVLFPAGPETDRRVGVVPEVAPGSSRLHAVGRVAAVDGEWADVLTPRQTGCSGCGSQEGCGTAALAKLFVPRRAGTLRVRNTLGVVPGDEVRLSMDESQFIQHSFMAYGIPLMGLFVVGVLVHWISQAWANPAVSEIVTILGGVSGMVIGWLGVRWFYRPAPPLMEAVLAVSEVEKGPAR